MPCWALLAAACLLFLAFTGAGAAAPAPATFVATGPSSWELSNGLVKTTFVGGREQAYFTNLGGAWVQGAFAPAMHASKTWLRVS